MRTIRDFPTSGPLIPDDSFILGAYVLFPSNHFVGAWRHAYSEVDFNDRGLFEDVGRTLDRSGFDLAFIPETLSFGEEFAKYGLSNGLKHEPTQLAAVIAGASRRLGVGVTLSASYNAPYHLARTLLSLEHFSGGRVWWNVIQSESDAAQANFPDVRRLHSPDSYDRGDEVVEATLSLIQSWGVDALTADKSTGIFANIDDIDRTPYRGEHVSVAGPLSLPPSSRGRIGLIQAGDSDRGRDFGARWGDLVFVIEPDETSLRAKRDDLRQRAVRLGRREEDIRTVAALQVVIGETESIARARQEYLNEIVSLEAALAFLSFFSGVDLRVVPPNESFLQVLVDSGRPLTRANRFAQGLADLEGKAVEALDVESAARAFARNELTPQIVGTPQQVADELIHLYDSGALDGIILSPTHFPGAFDEFGRSVAPILHRSGRTAASKE